MRELDRHRPGGWETGRQAAMPCSAQVTSACVPAAVAAAKAAAQQQSGRSPEPSDTLRIVILSLSRAAHHSLIWCTVSEM